MLILISLFLFVVSRGFHLAHRDLSTSVGSWVAVEPNGTGLPSTINSVRLGALPHRLSSSNQINRRAYKPNV